MDGVIGRKVRWVSQAHELPESEWDCSCLRVGSEGLIVGVDEFGGIVVDWLPGMSTGVKLGLVDLGVRVYSPEQLGTDFVLTEH